MGFCFDVFAAGTPVVDYFASAKDAQLNALRLKKGGSNFMDRKSLEKICSSLKISRINAGDNARNVCEGVSYLGGKCAYAGSLAADKEGKIFSASLHKHKIASCLQFTSGTSGKILALITPDKQRTFAVSLGNSEKYSKLELASLKNSKYLFLTSITALSHQTLGKTTAKLMQRAKSLKVPLAFSLESPPMVKQRRKELLSLLKKFPPEILFANEEEFASLDISAKKFLSLAKIVVLKKGSRGATVFADGKCINVPAKKVKVVDTTGAGDFFASGFLYGMCKKKNLEECGSFGTKLAARAISRMGATLS
ncbi:putative sugar kinase [Candidatus Anstonella stagnisolia]|nr:putative sugar kinase [Candidatus Anstonella stagnisolia]